MEWNKQALIEFAAQQYLVQPLPPFWETMNERKLMNEVARLSISEFSNTPPEIVWRKILNLATDANKNFVIGDD